MIDTDAFEFDVDTFGRDVDACKFVMSPWLEECFEKTGDDWPNDADIAESKVAKSLSG